MSIEEELAALNQAIASGEKRVQFDGRVIEYRDVDELIKARNDLIKRQTAANGKSRIPLAGRTWRAWQSGDGL